jgi:hypothetical protein
MTGERCLVAGALETLPPPASRTALDQGKKHETAEGMGEMGIQLLDGSGSVLIMAKMRWIRDDCVRGAWAESASSRGTESIARPNLRLVSYPGPARSVTQSGYDSDGSEV